MCFAGRLTIDSGKVMRLPPKRADFAG